MIFFNHKFALSNRSTYNKWECCHVQFKLLDWLAALYAQCQNIFLCLLPEFNTLVQHTHNFQEIFVHSTIDLDRSFGQSEEKKAFAAVYKHCYCTTLSFFFLRNAHSKERKRTLRIQLTYGWQDRYIIPNLSRGQINESFIRETLIASVPLNNYLDSDP